MFSPGDTLTDRSMMPILVSLCRGSFTLQVVISLFIFTVTKQRVWVCRLNDEGNSRETRDGASARKSNRVKPGLCAVARVSRLKGSGRKLSSARPHKRVQPSPASSAAGAKDQSWICTYLPNEQHVRIFQQSQLGMGPDAIPRLLLSFSLFKR